MVAFSNALGGMIIIGVRDNGEITRHDSKRPVDNRSLQQLLQASGVCE
jgi:predicted HTH transcriptional regulator